MTTTETQTEQRAIEQLRSHTDAAAMRRERIATAALQGLLACPDTKGDEITFAKDALRFADAMISELDRKEGVENP